MRVRRRPDAVETLPARGGRLPPRRSTRRWRWESDSSLDPAAPVAAGLAVRALWRAGPGGRSGTCPRTGTSDPDPVPRPAVAGAPHGLWAGWREALAGDHRGRTPTQRRPRRLPNS